MNGNTEMFLSANTQLQNGKYRIVRHISSGGFGHTYEAVHTMLDAKVAVKEFFPKMFCDRDDSTHHMAVSSRANRDLVDKLRKKFNEEAAAVFRMRHDNIVRVTDIFEENGTAYYVMDYIEGRSLQQIVRGRGALPETEALGYIRQVAGALRYVHSLNRLHLDIKPGNVMVDARGHVTLIDFGASKHYDDASGENTSTLMGVNTKGYAPIEQTTQSFTKFSPATDIYALGATLYKLLTGITPPDANMLMLGEESLPPLPANVSAATCNAVKAAMAPKRTDRPQSIDAFLSLLGSASVAGRFDDEGTLIEGVGIQVIKSDKFNGHEYVDLGLPSGLLWATCNVGASKPEEYGDYFAWGETKTKSGYSESNSTTSLKRLLSAFFPSAGYLESNSATFGKTIEELKSAGIIGGNGCLTPAYDAARKAWGGTWRMPTYDEIQELIDNTTTTWTTQNGVKGRKVTSKSNGNSIFLPAAGCRYGTSLCGDGSFGEYWSSSPSASNAYGARRLYFNSGYFSMRNYGRYNGRTVRPVSEP